MSDRILLNDPAEIQARHELDVFGKRGITLVRGQGALVWDDADRRYIDCIGGQGSANLGHAHPRLLKVLQHQAARLISCPGAFYNDAKAQFLKTLIEVTPAGLDRAFLCNSGTESVEAAIKFARLSTGRARIIAAKRGFHGRTYGAMSATFNPKYAKGCGPLVPGFDHVPFNRIDALEETMGDDVAALILEVIQGEGGVHPADGAYLARARQLCDQHGALLVVDEVQTGFGRTGKMFACEHEDLRPDILCLAKSIAGGLPMGATVCNERVVVPIGKHGTTFGGNPLVCAVGTAAIEELVQGGLAERARQLGDDFAEQFARAQLPVVREVRQVGLMIGIELKTKARPYLQKLMERGILALPAGATVLRLLPPLVIEADQMAEVCQTLVEVLSE